MTTLLQLGVYVGVKVCNNALRKKIDFVELERRTKEKLSIDHLPTHQMFQARID